MEYMECHEITDYRLDLDLMLGIYRGADMNADEVVETAHEYGIDIPYESLPTVPGEVARGECWKVVAG